MVETRRRGLFQEISLRLPLGAKHRRYRLQQVHVIRVGVLLRKHFRELHSHLTRLGAGVKACSRYVGSCRAVSHHVGRNSNSLTLPPPAPISYNANTPTTSFPASSIPYRKTRLSLPLPLLPSTPFLTSVGKRFCTPLPPLPHQTQKKKIRNPPPSPLPPTAKHAYYPYILTSTGQWIRMPPLSTR